MLEEKSRAGTEYFADATGLDAHGGSLVDAHPAQHDAVFVAHPSQKGNEPAAPVGVVEMVVGDGIAQKGVVQEVVATCGDVRVVGVDKSRGANNGIIERAVVVAAHDGIARRGTADRALLGIAQVIERVFDPGILPEVDVVGLVTPGDKYGLGGPNFGLYLRPAGRWRGCVS